MERKRLNREELMEKELPPNEELLYQLNMRISGRSVELRMKKTELRITYEQQLNKEYEKRKKIITGKK